MLSASNNDLNTHSKKVIEKLINIPALKVAAMSLFGLASSFFAPIWPFVLGSFLLVQIDYFIGVKAAKKRGEKITSKGMRRSIDKILIYMLFIIAAHVIDVLFKVPFSPLSYISALAVARVEFFSIDENVNQLTGVSVWKHVKGVFDASRNK